MPDNPDPPNNAPKHSRRGDRQSLDPDPETMRRLGYELVDRVVDHITSLPEQRVCRRGTLEDFSKLVDEPLPESPTKIEQCFEFFFDQVVPEMSRVNHPRFFGFIPSPSSFAGALGAMLAAGTNPFVGTWLGGATISALELTVLRWLGEMVGYDPQAAGILTSGGSMANLGALAAARAKFGPDILQRGRIYASQEGHASLNKAAGVLGFPPDAIRTIDVDASFRMQLDTLSAAIEADRQQGQLPFFVAANAGTTNSGTVDPLLELSKICQQQGLWYHVDAAYGGFAALTASGRARLEGMSSADSITLDPHKWLYCPMGVGCVLVRDRESLEQAFSAHGSYLKDIPTDEVNFMDRGPELSRPARVLSVWMVIRALGRGALAEQIEEDMRLARVAADLLGDDDRLEVHPPELSVVTFRHRARPGESEADRALRDTALMEATLADGELMLSTTLLQDRSTLRFVVMNHRTTEADVHRSVEHIRTYLEATTK